LGVADRVHFLGSTMTPGPLLADADVLATATLADPCPLTVIEARLAGCAIVATRTGGIPEILERGDAGQLVDVRAPEQMAAAFRALMADPAVLAHWQRRARRGADYFGVARVAADHDRVYAYALGRSPQPWLQRPVSVGM